MTAPSSVVLEKVGLGLILLLALFAFMVMSAVFAYHWKRFGIQSSLFQRMKRLYFVLAGGLATLATVLYLAIIGTF